MNRIHYQSDGNIEHYIQMFFFHWIISWGIFVQTAVFRIMLLTIFGIWLYLKVIFIGMVYQLNTSLVYLYSFDKYVVHERKAVRHFVFMFPFCAKAKRSYPLVRTELTEHGTERVHCVHVLVVLEIKDKENWQPKKV